MEIAPYGDRDGQALRHVGHKDANGKAKGDAQVVAKHQADDEEHNGRHNGHAGNDPYEKINLARQLAVRGLFANRHLGNLTQHAPISRPDDDPVAFAVHNGRAAKGQVGGLQGIVLGAGERAILSFALSRYGGVVNLHVSLGEESTVGRYLVAGLEIEHVSLGHLGCGERHQGLSSDHSDFGRDHGEEQLQDGRGLVLLVKINKGVRQRDEKQNNPQIEIHHGSSVNRKEDQRQDSANDQKQVQKTQQMTKEHTKGRPFLRRRNGIRPIYGQSACRLRLAKALTHAW